MVGWELTEFLTLERPHGAHGGFTQDCTRSRCSWSLRWRGSWFARGSGAPVTRCA